MKTTMNPIVKCLSLLLAAVIALACAPCRAEAAPRAVETPEDAAEWIGILLGGHPEALADGWLWTDEMRTAVTAMGGPKGLALSLAGLGAVQRIETAYEAALSGYRTFHVPCVFAALSIDLIVVTEQGAVAGLTTGAYTGGQVPASDAYESVDLSLPVPALDGALPGTLTLPRGDGPFPAVVLVHGSGPSDRDETMGQQKPFRDLAEGLAEAGAAVYRYDKRTYVYGARMAADHGITLVDETIEDACAAVRLLAGQPKIDPDRIFVLGHSLGGNAVPAIFRTLRDQGFAVRGCVMLAASPRSLDTLMREQYDFLYSLMPDVTPQQQAEKDALFRELDRLADPEALAENDLIAGVYAPYWQWLAAYDVPAAAQEMTCPCLLMQGEEDYQVTMTDFALWQAALSGRDNWRLVSFPGLTHAFTAGKKTEGPAAYTRPETMDSRVIREIADFIHRAAAE